MIRRERRGMSERIAPPTPCFSKALLVIFGISAACQPIDARHDTQDDKLLDLSGGAPALIPPVQLAGGGNGGSAGASGGPNEEMLLQIPCEIEAIFGEYCFKCHADRIEPRLDLFESARAAAPQIRGALVGTGPREMPPRESLPATKRQQIVDWIKAGTPPALPDSSCP